MVQQAVQGTAAVFVRHLEGLESMGLVAVEERASQYMENTVVELEMELVILV